MVSPVAATEIVVSGFAFEDVVAGVADKLIGMRIASAVDVIATDKFQVFYPGVVL
jgi:hypothetical protein